MGNQWGHPKQERSRRLGKRTDKNELVDPGRRAGEESKCDESGERFRKKYDFPGWQLP